MSKTIPPKTGGVRASLARKGGQQCRCCAHPEAVEIDEAILNGGSLRYVGDRFGMSPQSVMRHKRHMAIEAMQAAARAAIEAEGVHAEGLVQSAANLRARALAILETAEKAGALETALKAIREAARCLELIAKLEGAIDTSATVNPVYAPIMIRMQQIVGRALMPFPEARQAVVTALASLRTEMV
jgi:hypothetical protein